LYYDEIKEYLGNVLVSGPCCLHRWFNRYVYFAVVYAPIYYLVYDLVMDVYNFLGFCVDDSFRRCCLVFLFKPYSYPLICFCVR